jgi:hypothetical protein
MAKAKVRAKIRQASEPRSSVEIIDRDVRVRRGVRTAECTVYTEGLPVPVHCPLCGAEVPNRKMHHCTMKR